MSEVKKLGVISASSYLICDIIGSGIFVSPTDIVRYSGSVGLSLIVWALCGLLSLLGALCYIELGTSIPYSGGDFAYLCFYGWEPLAFAFVWTYFVIYKPCSLAISMKTFGTYVVQAFSPLLEMTEEVQDTAAKLFGVSLLRQLRKVFGTFGDKNGHFSVSSFVVVGQFFQTYKVRCENTGGD